VGQRLVRAFGDSAEHDRLVPVGDAHRLLHPLTICLALAFWGDTLSHGLEAFTLTIEQQSADVVTQRIPALRAPQAVKAILQVGQEL
jgi:hypothetical protein